MVDTQSVVHITRSTAKHVYIPASVFGDEDEFTFCLLDELLNLTAANSPLNLNHLQREVYAVAFTNQMCANIALHWCVF